MIDVRFAAAPSLGFVGLCLSICAASAVARAQPGENAPTAECVREDLEAVVDEAGAALRKLNQQNKPKFQDRLRQLKDKRGWSHDAFLKNAAPYVRDEEISVYDKTSADLLREISTLGEEGAEARQADCALLIELRARMTILVKTQNDKWTYMFDKLDKALQ